MSQRNPNNSLVLLLTVGVVLVALGGAAFLAVQLAQIRTPDRELQLEPRYTRVPLTPGTALAQVSSTLPPSYTPAPSGAPDVAISGGGSAGSGSVALRTVTPNLSDYASVRRASPTATPTMTPFPITRISATPVRTPSSAEPQGTPLFSNGAGTVNGGSGSPPATLTPSATPVPTLPPTFPPSNPRSPKKGIAAAHAYDEPNGHVPFNISWYHTWSLFPGLWNHPNVEFIPFWPCNGSVEYVVGTLGSNYSGYLLLMNEPDLPPPQCTMSVQEAADFYIAVRSALPNARLIGPNVSAEAWNGNRTGYLTEWRERVRQLTGSYPDVAGYAFHVYPVYTGIGTAQMVRIYCNQLAAWGELGQKELWVTEFGYDNFGGEPDTVRNRVRGAVEIYENGVGIPNCEIERYAYFTDRRESVSSQPTPTVVPSGNNYFDLYWRNSRQLSYTGEAYATAP